MDTFIAEENVKRFKRQLKDCTDERQRETLRQLLIEEEARLRTLENDEDLRSS